MKRLILNTVVALAVTAAVIGAQGPRRGFGPGPMPGPRGGMGAGAGLRGAGPAQDPAEFLLSHTGEFKLTDAQVTRLAAIARRSADRRQAMRTQLDSMRSSFARGSRPDSVARAGMRQRMEQMRPQMDRMREQSQNDRRDAIAVLTPDQQAQAWDRIATMGRTRMGGNTRRGFVGRRVTPRRAMPRNSAGRQDARRPFDQERK